MPDAIPSLKEDLAALVSGATAPPAAAPATTESTPAPATTETEVEAGAGEEKPGETKEAEQKAEVETKPPERPNPWSPELQKWTQKQTARFDALQRENEALKAQISKIAQQLGVEEAPAPTAAATTDKFPETTPAANGTSEQSSELAELRQKQMLIEIRLQYPNSNPEKMLDESVIEAMGILGLPPDAEELPPDLTAQAFQRVANGIFQKKVAALAKAPKAPEPVKKPQPPSRLPPKTPGGASIGTPPVSHQPSRRAAGGNTPSFQEDCAKLVGQTP